jgi:ABC-type antimicrobial peptide transport system permease subunit
VSAALLGLREALTTWRWQTILGALTTGVAAAFLGAVLSLSQHFRSSLDTSALGDQLAAQVTPYDIALGVIAVALGTLTAVSVVLVSTQERLPHFATLRALGWPRRHLARVVIAQALTVGLGGGLAGTLALSLMSWRVQDALTTTMVTTLAPLAVGLACGGIAAAIAVSVVYRRTMGEVLRGA